MSKTIRVSDDLYQVIDNYRRKDETFQEVVERMAHEIGLLPSRIKDLEHLRQKLENLYEYEPEEVEDVFDALAAVYVGQETASSIGIPHDDVESEFGDELQTLKRLGLIQEHHYTGKYDYGYEGTQIGNRIGSELVRERIERREGELRAVLEKYPDYEIAVFVNTGLERTDLGHLTMRSGTLGTDYKESLLESERLLERFERFVDDVAECGLAVRRRQDGYSVLPAELHDYLATQTTSLSAALREVEIYEAIRTYETEELRTREELLDQLHAASESELETVVESFCSDGLTSRYVRQDDQPLLIKDSEALLDRIRTDLREEIGSTPDRAGKEA